MFKVPTKCRITKGPMASDDTYGNNGAFEIEIEKGVTAFVMASDGMKWEHVSVHIVEDGKQETPTWDEMCIIKDMFWGEDDCVVQYHPPKSEYVNHHQHCLHLWRPIGKQIPMPSSYMVGVKKKG